MHWCPGVSVYGEEGVHIFSKTDVVSRSELARGYDGAQDKPLDGCSDARVLKKGVAQTHRY